MLWQTCISYSAEVAVWVVGDESWILGVTGGVHLVDFVYWMVGCGIHV
jgi:hypothetical protein